MGDNVNFIKSQKTKFKSYFAMLMCALTAITGFCGCSFDYVLNDDTADNITGGVYSSDTETSENQSSQNSETESAYISGENAVGQDGEIIPEIGDITDTAVTYTFRNDKLLNDHFEKHGEDFDYTTVEEYVEGANRVINDENSLHKLEAEDGDDVYYLEETNEFVIVSTDGYIRTYFKPSKGIDYYNRQ